MNDRARELRRRVAECIRQFMSGNVSCDHLIEEFKNSEDTEVREIVALIEEATAHIDKYERLDRSESEFKAAMDELIRRLEESREPT